MQSIGRFSVALLVVTAAIAVSIPMSAFADSPSEVWVDDDADEAEADGSEEHPYTTIQDGINAVAVGGTVNVAAGVYDKGEVYARSHSNRVSITKKVFLEGAGKDVTHIVGFRDFVNGDAYGRGPTSVRCIYLTTGANGGYMRGFTIRDGGAASSGESVAWGGGVGGGVNTSNSSKNTSTFCLVDCVVSNCAAVIGGGLDGVTAVRCLISGNTSSSYGAGGRFCNLVNCLVADNVVINGTKVYAAVGGGTNVNCTVVNTTGSKAYGFGIASTALAGKPKMYNCISFGNSYGDIVGSSDVAVQANTYTTADDEKMLYDPDNGDYRLMAGSVALGGGLTEYLALVKLPEGISANVDFAGNQIDPDGIGACDAGCFQGAVSPTVKKVTIEAEKGGLAVTGGVVGENVLEPGTSITISESDVGTRPCVGFSVDGTDYLFADTPSITFTAAEVEASERGFVVSAIYSKHWYADANALDDSGSGFRPEKPKKLLSSVLPLTSSGDTVHAAAGRYDQGAYSLSGGRAFRAYIPGGVTLVADEGPDVTFIVGAPATEPRDSYGLGLGTNATSCVYLGRYGHVKGFTLTGGHTDYATEDGLLYGGGGVSGAALSQRDDNYVEDCVISNNCASYGAGARGANLIRCRVFDNRALRNGGGILECTAYGTVFDRNRQGTESSCATCRNVGKLFGCTIGPLNLTLDGATTCRALGAVSGPGGQFHGCLFLGGVNDGSRTKFDTPSTYCVFTTTKSGFPTNEGCVVVSASVAKTLVDSDLRPVVRESNPAMDGWDNDSFASYASYISPDGKDISGEPRVRNGRVDIGALESDPKPWYAQLLDGKGRNITVTAADNMVTNIANGVTLQDGMSVALTWTVPADGVPRMGHICVSGGGTLTVTVDGEPYATYTAEDGEVEFSFAPAGRSASMEFSFAGEGSADVFDFSAPTGLAIFFK